MQDPRHDNRRLLQVILGACGAGGILSLLLGGPLMLSVMLLVGSGIGFLVLHDMRHGRIGDSADAGSDLGVGGWWGGSDGDGDGGGGDGE